VQDALQVSLGINLDGEKLDSLLSGQGSGTWGMASWEARLPQPSEIEGPRLSGKKKGRGVPIIGRVWVWKEKGPKVGPRGHQVEGGT